MRSSRSRLVAAALALASALPARAWIWPEHRDIAVEAIQGLAAAERKALDAMWAETRTLGGKQVCAGLTDPGSEPKTSFSKQSLQAQH